jgi:outer membrane usher protein
VNLSSLAQVRVEYDSAAQRLLLTVPRDWVTARVTPFSAQTAQAKPHLGAGRC